MDKRFEDADMTKAAGDFDAMRTKESYWEAAKHWHRAALIISSRLQDASIVIAGITETLDITEPENYDEAEHLVKEAISDLVKHRTKELLESCQLKNSKILHLEDRIARLRESNTSASNVIRQMQERLEELAPSIGPARAAHDQKERAAEDKYHADKDDGTC